MPHLTFLPVRTFLLLLPLAVQAAVRIEPADYEGRPQLKVTTAGATWYYDQAGGGFSRLLDHDGHDWISFHREPLDQSPASAAAGYRGLPNAVFGKDNPDAGAGHPGFDRCVSVVVGADTIRTTTKSGRWAWTWQFTDTHASFTLERADAAFPWWFLYEGTPGGRFAPRAQYWGTDLGGPRRETPNHKRKGEDLGGKWRWMYFGDDTAPRVLFIAERSETALDGILSYFGNDRTAGLDSPAGMIVAGFGRAPGGPGATLTGAGRTFVVGFAEERVEDEAAHRRLAEEIFKSCQP